MSKVRIFNNIDAAEEVMSVYANKIAYDYTEYEHRKRRITALLVVSFSLFIASCLTTAIVSSLLGRFPDYWVLILYVAISLTFIVAFYVFFADDKKQNNRHDYKKASNLKDAVRCSTKDKFGNLPEIWEAYQTNRLFQVRLCRGNNEKTVILQFYYSLPAPSRTVSESKVCFDVVLSSDEMYIDMIMIDLLNKKVVTHYSNNFNYGALYNLIEEDYDENDSIL